MSDKKKLNEATIKRFQKLARIDSGSPKKRNNDEDFLDQLLREMDEKQELEETEDLEEKEGLDETPPQDMKDKYLEEGDELDEEEDLSETPPQDMKEKYLEENEDELDVAADEMEPEGGEPEMDLDDGPEMDDLEGEEVGDIDSMGGPEMEAGADASTIKGIADIFKRLAQEIEAELGVDVDVDSEEPAMDGGPEDLGGPEMDMGDEPEMDMGGDEGPPMDDMGMDDEEELQEQKKQIEAVVQEVFRRAKERKKNKK